MNDRKLKCWGRGLHGRLGLGHEDSIGDGAGEMGSSLLSVDLGTNRYATQVSVGEDHSCALLDTGDLQCWGYGGNGHHIIGSTANIGDTPGEMGNDLTRASLGTNRTAVQLSTGAWHTCVILDDGSVKCAGYNAEGQLGLGNTSDYGSSSGSIGDHLPTVDLGTGRTATYISSSHSHNCAVLDTAQVKCWGKGLHGRLGQGSTDNLGDQTGEMGDSLPAVDLGTGRTALSVHAGELHSCALLDNSKIKCWGSGDSGQLGTENTNNIGDQVGEMGDNLAEIDIGTGRTASQITTGSYHTCAVLDNGEVKCWGYANTGEIGSGSRTNIGATINSMGDSLTSINLGTSRTALHVQSIGHHTCALLDDYTLKCWGNNLYGQLGQGDTAHQGDDAGEMGDTLPTTSLK